MKKFALYLIAPFAFLGQQATQAMTEDNAAATPASAATATVPADASTNPAAARHPITKLTITCGPKVRETVDLTGEPAAVQKAVDAAMAKVTKEITTEVAATAERVVSDSVAKMQKAVDETVTAVQTTAAAASRTATPFSTFCEERVDDMYHDQLGRLQTAMPWFRYADSDLEAIKSRVDYEDAFLKSCIERHKRDGSATDVCERVHASRVYEILNERDQRNLERVAEFSNRSRIYRDGLSATAEEKRKVQLGTLCESAITQAEATRTEVDPSLAAYTHCVLATGEDRFKCRIKLYDSLKSYSDQKAAAKALADKR